MYTKKKTKILITGGAGYLGSHLTKLMRDRCIVYDDLLYTCEYMREVDFVRGDVTEYPKLQKYLNKVDCVVWLAAIVGDAACMINPRKAIATNTEAVKYLCEHFDGPIIFMSSCSVYGISYDVAKEDTMLSPQSLYADTKYRAEKYLADKNSLILRLGTLHGISERMRFDLVVNVLTKDAILKGKIEIFGGGQYRPLASVCDIAEFIGELVDREWPAGIYNIASENLTICQIAEVIKKEIPEVQLKTVDSPFEDQRNYRVNTTKAENNLGFRGRRSVRDSVLDIMHLLREGRIRDLSDPRYANVSMLQNTESKR